MSGESNAEVAAVSAELEVVDEETNASEVEEEEEEKVGSSAAMGEEMVGMIVEEGESRGRVWVLPEGEEEDAGGVGREGGG